MTPRFQAFDQDALAALDEFLGSDEAVRGFDLSGVDGFLVAIAVGPELIPPSNWLPEIFGSEDCFHDLDEANAVISAMVARYNQIIRQVQDEEFTPIFRETSGGDMIAVDWAKGFLAGIMLRLDQWEPLFRDEEGQGMLFPILALCGDEQGGNLLELDDDERQEVLREAPDMIPACVEAIHGFWKERKA